MIRLKSYLVLTGIYSLRIFIARFIAAIGITGKIKNKYKIWFKSNQFQLSNLVRLFEVNIFAKFSPVIFLRHRFPCSNSSWHVVLESSTTPDDKLTGFDDSIEKGFLASNHVENVCKS